MIVRVVSLKRACNLTRVNQLFKVNEMLAFYLQTTDTFQLVCAESNILTFLQICIISPSRYI